MAAEVTNHLTEFLTEHYVLPMNWPPRPIKDTERIDSGRGARCKQILVFVDAAGLRCRLGRHHGGQHDFGEAEHYYAQV